MAKVEIEERDYLRAIALPMLTELHNNVKDAKLQEYLRNAITRIDLVITGKGRKPRAVDA